MKKFVRLSALILVALMTLSAFAGCGDSANGGKDTVTVATADETPSINPADSNAVAQSYVNALMFNSLFRLDKNLNPVPDLAESYDAVEQADGSYLWTFKLKQGVKFHDGTVMNANDVAACLNNTKNMPEVSLYASEFAQHGVTVVDENTISLVTPGPSASLLYDLSHHGNAVTPKRFIDNGETTSDHPIGTGPYKFVKWSRGEQIEFTAHEDYFDKDNAPKIKNVIWRIIPEGSSRTIALEAGEVDYVIELDTTSVTSLDANDKINVMKVPSTSHNWLCINNEVEPFNDINVRKALNAAVNKENVIKVALNGLGIVASSQTPLGMLGEIGEYQSGYDKYDVALAKEYMAAWGGDPSTIKLDMICSNDTKRRAAEVIQDNLKEIGINAEIVSMDLATYLDETRLGNFSGFIGGWTCDEMMNFLKGVCHSNNINASNKTRAGSPELDAIIDQACMTIDRAEREQLLQSATRILNEACYQVPLYQDFTVSAHNVNLQNTFITAGGTIYINEWSWAAE